MLFAWKMFTKTESASTSQLASKSSYCYPVVFTTDNKLSNCGLSRLRLALPCNASPCPTQLFAPPCPCLQVVRFIFTQQVFRLRKTRCWFFTLSQNRHALPLPFRLAGPGLHSPCLLKAPPCFVIGLRIKYASAKSTNIKTNRQIWCAQSTESSYYTLPDAC